MNSNDNKKFIHFGCWNNQNCITDNIGFNKNARKLKKMNLREYDFISVAGDNYYPDKIKDGGKTTKTFNEKNFVDGFNCLPNHINKYVIFGNHDMIDEYDDGQCKALVRTKALQQQNMNIFDNVTHIFNNSTLIIFIDSTIYENDINRETKIKDSCYKNIFSDYQNKDDTLEQLKEYQTSQIFGIIERYNNIKNIIIIGHHPLFSIKSKFCKPKPEGILDFLNIYERITTLEKLSDSSFFYLCADVHLYQHSEITLKNDKIINQYIVGSGGANFDHGANAVENLKDKIDSIIEALKDKYNFVKYKILEEITMVYGFITVDYKDPSNIKFEFINSSKSIEDISESKRIFLFNKYIKYKNKYLSLKKMKL